MASTFCPFCFIFLKTKFFHGKNLKRYVLMIVVSFERVSVQILTEMGLCYQYNSNKTWSRELNDWAFKKVYKGGAGNGLKMLLTTQEDDYLPPKIEEFG